MFNWFKKKSFLGIDISDRSIKMVQIGQNKEVIFAGRFLLEAGVVTDGEILSKEILVERLKIMLDGAPADFPPAVLGMPESKTFIHFFPVGDNIKGPDLDKEVRANVFQLLPVDPETLYWDYVAVESQTGQDIFFVAIDKEILQGYLEVMRLAGVNLAAVEVESGALARALLPYPRAGAAVMIIDLGAEITSIGVFEDKNIPLLSLTVPVGGDHITRIISKELKVSYLEADKIRRSFGLGGTSDTNTVFAIIENEFKSILKEVYEVISYYEGKWDKQIGEIILAGGAALLPKVDEYLALKIKRPVSIGNPLKRLKKSPQLEKTGRAILSAGAIGLALRGMDDWSSGANLLKSIHDKGYQISSVLKEDKFIDLWGVFRKRVRFWAK